MTMSGVPKVPTGSGSGVGASQAGGGTFRNKLLGTHLGRFFAGFYGVLLGYTGSRAIHSQGNNFSKVFSQQPSLPSIVSSFILEQAIDLCSTVFDRGSFIRGLVIDSSPQEQAQTILSLSYRMEKEPEGIGEMCRAFVEADPAGDDSVKLLLEVTKGMSAKNQAKVLRGAVCSAQMNKRIAMLRAFVLRRVSSDRGEILRHVMAEKIFISYAASASSLRKVAENKNPTLLADTLVGRERTEMVRILSEACIGMKRDDRKALLEDVIFKLFGPNDRVPFLTEVNAYRSSSVIADGVKGLFGEYYYNYPGSVGAALNDLVANTGSELYNSSLADFGRVLRVFMGEKEIGLDGKVEVLQGALKSLSVDEQGEVIRTASIGMYGNDIVAILEKLTEKMSVQDQVTIFRAALAFLPVVEQGEILVKFFSKKITVDGYSDDLNLFLVGVIADRPAMVQVFLLAQATSYLADDYSIKAGGAYLPTRSDIAEMVAKDIVKSDDLRDQDLFVSMVGGETNAIDYGRRYPSGIDPESTKETFKAELKKALSS